MDASRAAGRWLLVRCMAVGRVGYGAAAVEQKAVEEVPVQPVPETTQALALLLGYGDELDARLQDLSEVVLRIVPQCVGVSLGLLREGLTFTLVAGHSEVAQLDALQYLAGGWCVDPVATGEDGDVEPAGASEEQRWLTVGRVRAAVGVRSTLSLPITEASEVVASLHLYASTADAFEGKRGRLAHAVGALESGAVADADLAFSTRLSAAATPVRLEDQGTVDRAVGLLAGELRTDVDTAARRLREAAARAGISAVQLARALCRLPAAEGAPPRE